MDDGHPAMLAEFKLASPRIASTVREPASAVAAKASGTPRTRSRESSASCVGAANCLAYAPPPTAAHGDGSVFDRFQRSWDLAAECWRLLMEDRTLLVFPLLSSIAMVLMVGSFALPLLPAFGHASGRNLPHGLSSLSYLGIFLFYWIQYSIVIFFNTALVEVAMRRFDGEEAGVADGLRRAAALLPVILVYALIAAAVGTLLRAIAERVGILARIVVALVGVGWTVATALVVPVLAAENVGPIEAIGRSADLIKKSWGEQIIGNTGIGLVFGAIIFLVAITGGVLVVAAFSTREWTLGLTLLVPLVLLIGLLVLAQATLQGIYSAALYRFATGDPATGGIDQRLLEGAFSARS